MVIIIRPHLGDGMRDLGQAPQRLRGRRCETEEQRNGSVVPGAARTASLPGHRCFRAAGTPPQPQRDMWRCGGRRESSLFDLRDACVGVSLSSQMSAQDTVTRLWQTGAALTSCRSPSPRCSAAATSAAAGLPGPQSPPRCVPSEQLVRALPFVPRASHLNPCKPQ